MADKDESVYGHHTLVETGIEIGLFPHDLMQDLLALNKKWSDSLRTKPIVPPNDTNAIASVSYYKLGTSMQDNTHFYVRPPNDADSFFTVEDTANNVVAHGRTIEEIAVEWHKLHVQKVHVEKLVRQSTHSSSQLLNLTLVNAVEFRACAPPVAAVPAAAEPPLPKIVVIMGAGSSADFGVPTLRSIFKDPSALAYLRNDTKLHDSVASYGHDNSMLHPETLAKFNAYFLKQVLPPRN
jgi:hypothetical protein